MERVCKKPKRSLLFKECEDLRTMLCGQAHRRGLEWLADAVPRWLRIPMVPNSDKDGYQESRERRRS